MTEAKVMEAKNMYLKAKNQSSAQKMKSGLDWFTLWLDYLQKRHQLSQEKIEAPKKSLNERFEKLIETKSS